MSPPAQRSSVSDAKRITELELELMAQRELLEVLNGELTSANETIEVLRARVERLERQVQELLSVIDLPVNEKPPHY